MKEPCPIETEMMLMHEVTKLFHEYVREEQADDRRTQTFRYLLHHLSVEDGRSQLELSHLLHISPPSVSVALQKMEADGYILRESDPRDLRSVRVYLTEKGRDADRKVGERMRALDEAVLSCLNEEQRSALKEALRKLRVHLTELLWSDIAQGGQI